MLEKGLVQIYTGDGKGKTTAALGLAVRTAGHGGKVLIYQFLKPSALDLGERGGLGKIGSITVLSLEEPWDMAASMEDKRAVEGVRGAIQQALRKIQQAAQEGYYDLIILDEIIFCLSRGLASMGEVRSLIASRDVHVELVLTGRGASEELIAMADLVTEMKSVKHPFDKGVGARKGIEY